jgi:hypothetical protein
VTLEVDDRRIRMTLTFLKSERAIDYLRWGGAFVTVVLAYGVAGWMLLRPTGWERGVNAPVVEIDLSDSTQLAAAPPTYRKNGSSDETRRGGKDAPDALSGPAGDQRDVAPAPRGDAAADNNEAGAPKAAATAEKAAAKDKADEPAVNGPGAPAGKVSETPPRTDATDSGGAGRPIATPPHIFTPDNSAAASIMRAPIDARIAPSPGRSLLRSAKGRRLFGPVPALPFKPAPVVATPKDRNDLFSRKPNPVAGLTLSIPLPTAPAANHRYTQGLAQKPAMGADGSLARNAIGVVIGQHTVVPQAGAPLGVHPAPGATAPHASGDHGPATTATGAPLAATTPKPSAAGPSAGAANSRQAGHPDQASLASHIASIGGPAIGGTPMFRPAYSTGAVGGSAKAVAGVISGANVRMRHP